MPLYNSRRDIVFGIDLAVWIKRADQPPVKIADNAGEYCWLNEEIALYQANARVGVPYIAASSGDRVADFGANRLEGGNGHWASFLAASPSVIKRSWGSDLVGAGKMAMAVDGTFVCATDYQGYRGVRIETPDGRITLLDDPIVSSAAADAQAVGWFPGGRNLILWDGHVRRLFSLAFATFEGSLVRHGGRIWVVYVSGEYPYGIIHPVDDPTVGYRFGDPNQAFNPSAISFNGDLWVCWSTTAGERETHIRELKLTELVSFLPTEPEPMPITSSIPAFPRKMWASTWHSFTEQYGYTTDPVGNTIWVSGSPADIRAAASTGWPLMLAVNDLTGVPYEEVASQVMGWWQSGGTIEDLSLAVSKAQTLPENPIIAYLDRRGWPDTLPANFTRGVIPQIQAYRAAGEPLEAFEYAIRADIERCLQWSPYVSLALRFDDGYGGSNTWSVEEVEKSMPIYERLTRLYPVILIQFFSDRRGHGMEYYPQLREWAKRFVAAIPLRPNRFDYWEPASISPETRLRNKLGQDVEMLQLSAGEKEILLRGLEKPPLPPPDPLPPPGAGEDEIDPALITWLSPCTVDVGGWAITSHLSEVSISGDTICLPHSKAGQWPLVSIDDQPPNIEGNPCIVARVGGRWYGAGFDWFGEGRTCKYAPKEELGRDQIRVSPLDSSWPGPQSGDWVGFLVTAPSSGRIPVRSVFERSNIKLVRWP